MYYQNWKKKKKSNIRQRPLKLQLLKISSSTLRLVPEPQT